MAKKFKVNKEKCIGCGVCVATCPGGAELEDDGKSKIIDSEKIEKCGGESVCPYGAIEEKK
jgi:NADH-quinone oxidoreductase subunit F